MKGWGGSISRQWVAAGAGIAVVLILLGYFLFKPEEPKISPSEAMVRALEETSRESSYEYRVRMSTLINGEEELISDVKGQRENSNRIHISGRIFESDIDFYQVDSSTFTKDPLNGEWIKITDNQINQEDIFMQELNPLAGFAYKELNDAAYVGTEELEGEEVWVYTASSVVDNPYMDVLWKDFRYKFWVKPGSFLLHNAEISAVSKNDPANKLLLTVELRNYGGSIKVRPPAAAKEE